MSNKNPLEDALETLKRMFVPDTKTIDNILNTEGMAERERKSWMYVRTIVIHLGIMAKIETMMVEWMRLDEIWWSDFGTDMLKAIEKIPELERGFKRLKKKKQQMELRISKKYEQALEMLTRQIEESARAQQHYVT
jgi:hypothetical protein